MNRDIDIVRDILDLDHEHCDPCIMRAVAAAAEQMAINAELRKENQRLRAAHDALEGRGVA